MPIFARAALGLTALVACAGGMANAATTTGLKNVLIWDPRFPDRAPTRVVVTTPVAQALVADGNAAIESAIPDPVSVVVTFAPSLDHSDARNSFYL